MPRLAGTRLDTDLKGGRSKFVKFIEWVGGEESDERKLLVISYSKHGRGTRGAPPPLMAL